MNIWIDIKGGDAMKYGDYEIKFYVDRYAKDRSTYIEALVMENGEPVDCYADVTICGMYNTFRGEAALDVNNVGDLIDAMVHNELIEITPRIAVRSGFCEYPIGKLTKKFFNEVVGDKAEAYERVFMD
jgi:hypothetical protein